MAKRKGPTKTELTTRLVTRLRNIAEILEMRQNNVSPGFRTTTKKDLQIAGRRLTLICTRLNVYEPNK